MELAFLVILGSTLFWLGRPIKLNTIIIIIIVNTFNDPEYKKIYTVLLEYNMRYY